MACSHSKLSISKDRSHFICSRLSVLQNKIIIHLKGVFTRYGTKSGHREKILHD